MCPEQNSRESLLTEGPAVCERNWMEESSPSPPGNYESEAKPGQLTTNKFPKQGPLERQYVCTCYCATYT